MSADLETAMTQDWKRSVFIPIPKKGNVKECSNYQTIVLISHTSRCFPSGASGKKKTCMPMQEMRVPSLVWEDPLEDMYGNPLQDSCLKNPMDREEFGGLQSIGSQRVGHA